VIAVSDACGRVALQQRRELVPGQKMLGLEGTFAVDSIDLTHQRA